MANGEGEPIQVAGLAAAHVPVPREPPPRPRAQQDGPPAPDDTSRPAPVEEQPPNHFAQYDKESKVNHFAQYDSLPTAGNEGLYERWRLSEINAYYRGTLSGAGDLTNLYDIYTTDQTAGGITGDEAWIKERKKDYERITADLIRWDQMRPWGTALEAATSLAGTVVGGVQSPEVFIGPAVRGATVIGRTIKQALTQGTLAAAADIPIQHLNVASRVQHEYEYWQTVGAFGFGMVIGGGLHFATGELLPAWLTKATLKEHGIVDPTLRRPDEAMSRAGPELPRIELFPEARAAEVIEGQARGIAESFATLDEAKGVGFSEEFMRNALGWAQANQRPELVTRAIDLSRKWGQPEFAAELERTAPRIEAPAPRAPEVPEPEAPVLPEQATPNIHRVTTPAGQSVEVQPVVMEARDLITSSDTGYDPALQPRDRSRIASQQQIREIAANLDPQRLGFSTEAGFGAPIIGPDKMVESGNARVMAIRQAYLEHPERAQAYRDWIAAQGLDVSGFEQPVVVRQRTTVMTPEERQVFTVGANQPATLTMAASERALTDARLITIDSLGLLRVPDDLGAAGNRDFIRSFLGRLPVTEQGAMVTPEGALTAEGLTRVRNAIVAKAYGDAPVLTRIAESTDDEIKSISNALVAVAPEWAKLRADVDAGNVRADVEQTGALVEAVTRTADLRGRGQRLDSFLAQQDAFEQIDPIVANFMWMFYDAKGRRAAGAQKITDRLRFYAEEARKVSEGGLDLGLAPVTPEELQRVARERTVGAGIRAAAEIPPGGGVGAGPGVAAGGLPGGGPGLVEPGIAAGGVGAPGYPGPAGRPPGAPSEAAIAAVRAPRTYRGALVSEDGVFRTIHAAEGGFIIRTPEEFGRGPGTVAFDGRVFKGSDFEQVGSVDLGYGRETSYRLKPETPEPEVMALRTAQRLRQTGPDLFAQREAEGQARLPGQAAPTTKEQLDLEAMRPLTGGAAPPAAGGLFDVEGREQLAAQGALFMRAPRVPRPAVEPGVPSAPAARAAAEPDIPAPNEWLVATKGVREMPAEVELNATREEIIEVQQAIARGAGPDEIEATPLIKRAYERSKEFEPTDQLPGYGTPEYRATRKFVFNGETVIGYTAAIDRQEAGAKAFSTDGPVRNEKRAFIVTGPGGAGKSTNVANPLARRTFSAVVDADEAKPNIPEFRGGIGASAVHEESTHIIYGNPDNLRLDSVFGRLTDEGANVVIGKIGHNVESIRKLQRELTAAGYEVNLINLVVDPKEAFRRRIERFLRTGRINGAGYHSDRATVGAADKASQNYYILKGDGKYAEALEIDVNGRPPKILDGEETSLPDTIGFRGGRPGGPGGGGDLGVAAVEPGREAGTVVERVRQQLAQRRVPEGEPPLRETAESAVVRQQDWADYYTGKHNLPIEEKFREIADRETQALAQRRGGEALPGERVRPAGGIPEPLSPQQDATIRSLQQQAFDLADAIDFPLRQGRQARGTLGQFKPGEGVARVKEVPDFEVVSHEAGHAIEQKVGQSLKDLIRQFDHELAPLVTDPTQYPRNQHAREGFAEFIRRGMGSPADMQRQAPGFTTAFRQLLEREAPEVAAALDNAGTAYRAYQDAPSVNAVEAVRRSTSEMPRTLWGRVVKQVQDEGFFPSIKLMMQHGYTALSDFNAPMARAVRELTTMIRDQQGGKLLNLKAADNPEILLRLFARAEQAGFLDLVDGVRPYHDVTPRGPSLGSAIAKATGKPSFFGRWDTDAVASFDSFLIARRAEYLWRKYRAGQLQNPPVAFSHGDAMQAMADLERANPKFREASDMVHGWTRELLRKQYEGNLISKELYEKLVNEEFYVPFMRDLSDRPLAGGGFGGMSERVVETVKRMRGSSRDIISPLESLMTQSYLVNRAIKHNDVILALKNLSKQAGPEGGRFFEEVPATEAKQYKFEMREAIEREAAKRGVPPDDIALLSSALTDVFGKDPIVGSFWKAEGAGARGEPLVFYKENGQQKVGRVMHGQEGHAIYELLTGLPTGLQDLGTQMLAISSSTLRSGVVTNPVYVLTNYIRDQVAVGILRPDYIPFVSGMKGLVSEVTQGEAARLYGYAGGVSAGAAIAPVKQAAEANLNALARQGYLVNRVSSLQGMLELASITEAGTRNSVFEKVYRAGQRSGLSDYEAMVEAAWQATDSSLNFGQRGSKTMAVVALTPFVNAWQVGMDKAWRTMVTPIARRIAGKEATVADLAEFRNALLTISKLAAVGSALGAAWAALHADDEIYADASPSLKGTHFVTTVGNKIVVMPKPFELSIGFTAGEFAYQRLMRDDPRAAHQFAEAAWEVMKPPVPILGNPFIKTGFELQTNYNTFTGRPIVPDRLQRLAPEERFTDRTSSAAKYIGGVIGMSPIKVDHAIGGLFGTWGRDMAALSSSADPEAPAAQWEDQVFKRRFVKDPRRSSDATTKFWGYMGQTTGKFNQAVNTYDNLIKGFRDADAGEFLQKLPENERAYVVLRSGATDAGKPAFNADIKRLHPLQRSYDAVTTLNGLREEMSRNSFKLFETGENVKLDPTTRRDVLDNVRELSQKEMRNALIIMKEPGYTGRPLFDTKITLDKIRSLSPQVADEIVARYTTNKIYTTSAVASHWPQLKTEVLRDGSEADVAHLAYDAKGDGYEFGAEAGPRVKKPAKRRVPIPPMPQP